MVGRKLHLRTELPMTTYEAVITEIIRIFPLSATAIGLIIGLLQYRRAQIWKRMEFAASLVRRISADNELTLAITFLDWRHRHFAIPDKYKSVAAGRLQFCHSHEAMARVFSLSSREILPETGMLDLKPEEITLESMIYIDVFDRFFEYMEEINSFIEMGLVNKADVKLLSYWANRIISLKYLQTEIFIEYLKYYKLSGVFALANVAISKSL